MNDHPAEGDDFAHVRHDFPLLHTHIDGKPIIYLDSAATSQKPVHVLEAMDDFYRSSYANVHRSPYRLAEQATEQFELARAKVAAFIKARPAEVVFTRGATDALNLVASGWGPHHLQEGDRIVLTLMEHHANLVPWQMLARRVGAELAYVPYTPDYRVDLDAYHRLLDQGRVRVVAVTAASNVLGTVPPVAAMAAAAHEAGAIVVVDGAQSVPHMPTDVESLGADFLAFSAHKMLGPTGIGVLYGRAEMLEQVEPIAGGGEMIADVQLHTSTWAPVPRRFEAGTPPITEAVGLGAAVDYLTKVGMEAVARHETTLVDYALRQLTTVPELEIRGPAEAVDRTGAVSFTLGDIHPHDLATILGVDGVCIRAGHHCAKPLVKSLGIPATARASFYLYNTRGDVDALVAGLHRAREVFGVA